MVITLDSDSNDPGSIPGRTSSFFVFYFCTSFIANNDWYNVVLFDLCFISFLSLIFLVAFLFQYLLPSTLHEFVGKLDSRPIRRRKTLKGAEYLDQIQKYSYNKPQNHQNATLR